MALYIFDIDGTLADITHRRHFVSSKPRNWGAFNATMKDDSPVVPIIQLNQTLYRTGATILLCSGRGEENRKDTEEWLRENGVQYHQLFMRPEKNYEKDSLIKSRMADHIQETFGEISMVFDDRNQVVDMWRERGITCAQVDYGDF